MRSTYIPQRIHTFDAQPAMTVVDYGCGSGRFTTFFADKVGAAGKVYAVDIDPQAIMGIDAANIIPILASGSNSGLPPNIADRVYAIDMFHLIDDVPAFLNEICRIMKKDGIFYIDYGHQPKEQAIDKIVNAKVFQIVEVHSKHAVCIPNRHI